jgi:hypothetical protein
MTMTTKELREKITTATDVKWFKEIESTFNFPRANFNQTFKGVTAIYEFASQQLAGWVAIGSLPNELSNHKQYFESIIRQTERFVNSYITQTGNSLTNSWNSQVANYINSSQSDRFLYNTPEIGFLLDIKENFPQRFVGAHKTIMGQSLNNTRDELFGALMAYEFIHKDISEITQRRNEENKSISKIRSDFQGYLSQSESDLIEHLTNANSKYEEYVRKIDELTTDKDKEFTTWFTDAREEKWDKFYEPSVQKITELEETYREKLKLEAPAEHWEKRAKLLRDQGWNALVMVMFLLFVAIFTLGVVLMHSPEQMYVSWFGADKSVAIRWSIVFVTLVSFLAFAIRAVAKVMFSAFHLARDSEERHTLTFFYLALLKDSSVEKEDRQLIMQSLFSRADTGLLKDDGGPTMPNDVSKILGK